MQHLSKKNLKYLFIVAIIILLGVFSGIIYYVFQDSEIKSDIVYTLSNYNNFKYNNIFKDLIIMSFLLVTSFLIIGLPLSIFYLFYEGISLGFLISIFFVSFKVKGIIFILIYLCITKLFTFGVMIFFIKRLINITRFTIGYIIYKRDSSIKEKLYINFTKCLQMIIIVFIINIFLYFISGSFSNLNFLLQ